MAAKKNRRAKQFNNWCICSALSLVVVMLTTMAWFFFKDGLTCPRGQTSEWRSLWARDRCKYVIYNVPYQVRTITVAAIASDQTTFHKDCIVFDKGPNIGFSLTTTNGTLCCLRQGLQLSGMCVTSFVEAKAASPETNGFVQLSETRIDGEQCFMSCFASGLKRPRLPFYTQPLFEGDISEYSSLSAKKNAIVVVQPKQTLDTGYTVTPASLTNSESQTAFAKSYACRREGTLIGTPATPASLSCRPSGGASETAEYVTGFFYSNLNTKCYALCSPIDP